MKIIIRKALPDDAYDYTECFISCFQSAYKRIVPDEYLNNMLIEKEQLFEKHKRALADPGDCEYYCVMYSEKITGFLVINKKHTEKIWAIYLLEDFRSKGLGKEVLNFAVNELKSVENEEIALWVFEENIRARKFYEKNNFSFDGKKREMNYGKPLVQLRYVLNQ